MMLLIKRKNAALKNSLYIHRKRVQATYCVLPWGWVCLKGWLRCHHVSKFESYYNMPNIEKDCVLCVLRAPPHLYNLHDLLLQ